MKTWARLFLALLLAPGSLLAQENAFATLDSLMAAAQQGNPAAEAELARRYQDGVGVAQNYARAVEWFTRAAEAGDPQAQNQLGRHYHSGLGVTKDRQAALRWLEAAAEGGDPTHMFDLASVLEQDKANPAVLRRAAELYRRAADAGHVEAAVNLAVMYQDGIGVEQDFLRAKALYDAPAAAGHPRALNNLGLLHVRGNGVPQDYSQAAALFAAAAEAGLPQAFTNLGVMYENGFGVAQSDDEAARLYRLGGAGAAQGQAEFVYDPRIALPATDPEGIAALRAAALAGDPVAQFQLGWSIVQQGNPDPRDWQEAARQFSAAADKGHAASMANLGVLYEKGRGLPQDFVLAQMWFTRAGASGLVDVARLTADLQKRMSPEQINEAQSLAEAGAATSLPVSPPP